uniref:exportin-4-like n=1 Tax=Ciona intestinalis TaxID=7719 RepID=UPI000EF4B63E|nr:exportin-4-like [Ciona intestinalis]|eukprot:XP_026694918.1 exportin-4-like [Ciona intestinalis]
MSSDLVEKLEAATHASLAPPNLVSPEQRREAEEFLLSFRRSKVSFNVCWEILDKSSSPSVQYHAAATMKESVIRDWETMDDSTRLSVQQFILNFLTQRPGITGYVRGLLSNIFAVMLKRSSVASHDPTQRHPFYQHLGALVASNNETMETTACSILSAICVEFSASDKSSNVGLSWEQHAKCKAQFEKSDLPQIFQLTIQVLHQTSTSPNLQTSMCEKFYSIAEQILSWKFSPTIRQRRAYLESDSTIRQNFQPPQHWKQQILDPALLQLFFNLHSKVRTNESLCHSSTSCLSQLASLEGDVLKDVGDNVRYLTHYLQGFLHVYASTQPLHHEALGISNIVRNLVECHKLQIWSLLPNEMNLFPMFLERIARFTIGFGEEAAKEEELHEDDHLYMEAFETILDPWTTLIECMNLHDTMVYITPCADSIVKMYVKCHVSAPEGSRTQTNEDLEEDIDELEEEDREKFGCQLMSIASLARTSPHTCVPFITRLLEGRTDRLHGQLQRVGQQGGVGDPMLSVLFEDVHWLVLLAGHILADECEGETPLIPPEILKYSIDSKHLVDESVTMKVLGSPEVKINEIPGGEKASDPVVRLSSAVLRLSEVETRCLRGGLAGLLSPQLAQDILWFLRCWGATYLLYPEDNYKELSPVITRAFGRDSPGSKWLVEHFVNKIMTSLSHWGSELKVLEDSTQLLIMMVQNNHRCHLVVECPEFWDLCSKISENVHPYSTLPLSVKQNISTALVHAGSANMNQYKDKYWQQTLQPLHHRYHNLTTHPTFTQHKDKESTILELSSILSMLQGISAASTPSNTTYLFGFLTNFLPDCPKLIDIYHGNESLVVLILELYVEVVHKQICYLKQTQCSLLCDWTMNLLKSYSNHGNTMTSSEDDITLIIELLTNLLSKDFIDFSEPDADETWSIPGAQPMETSAADVVLFGLGIILPNMNSQLLLYPELCSQYFKLITFLCEIYPEKIEKLSDEMLQSFVYSLQIGLKSYGCDNCKLCLEAIESLSTHCYKTKDAPSSLHNVVSSFTKLVFDSLITHAADFELVRTAGETFYSLLCYQPQHTATLLQQVIDSQQDEQTKLRLSTSFANLTHDVSLLNHDRNSRTTFLRNLESIIYNIRGILCVK